MKIHILLILFVIFFVKSFSQDNNESILIANPTILLDPFFVDNKINLKKVREVTSFLTDRDILFYKKYKVSKRKKAFVRHVKHLSEIIECAFIDNKSRNKEIEEIIYELRLLELSLKQKAVSKSKTKVSLMYKIKMAIDTYRSKRKFCYRIPKKLSDTNFNELNSPYWNKSTNDKAIYKRFSVLAKQKKIKTKKNMVVLFKDLSLSGSAPKINALDIDLDNEWSLKWGDEVHTDVFGSRIFAALGYDVDHPYFYKENKLTLVFDEFSEIQSVEELIDNMNTIYKVDLKPFISNSGVVSIEMADSNKRLYSFIGKKYVQFVKCAIEARPDRVKRIGSFIPSSLSNSDRRELRASLLAHHFIGNWDTREENTLLTTVHMGNYNYIVSAVFSDLGTSLGVTRKYLPADFKVGLVNKLPWEVVKKKGNKIKFTNRINSILPCYKEATYEDLLWMAKKIAKIDSNSLRKMLEKACWPSPIRELYFHKMASRRASILKAFDIKDLSPIKFNKELTILEDGIVVIDKGELVKDYKPNTNPESFFKTKGRLRNYGN